MVRESIPVRIARLTVQWEIARDALGDPSLLDLAACPLPPAVEEACRAALHPAAADAYDALPALERWQTAATIVGALGASPPALDVLERGLYGGPLPPLERPRVSRIPIAAARRSAVGTSKR